MTSDQILDAIGLADETWVADAKANIPAPPRKTKVSVHRRVRRVALLAAVVSLFFTVTAYALGSPAGILSWSLSKGLGQKDFRFLPAYERQVGFPVSAVEEFSNGYRFRELSLVHNQVVDEGGSPLAEYPGLNLRYEKADAPDLYLAVEPAALSSEENAPAAAETREIDGVTVRYYYSVYMAVPVDYRPTAEEEARVASGELQIGYGSDAVQVNPFASIGFVIGDVRYTLLSFADYDADFMFQMAAELLAA